MIFRRASLRTEAEDLRWSEAIFHVVVKPNWKLWLERLLRRFASLAMTTRYILSHDPLEKNIIALLDPFFCDLQLGKRTTKLCFINPIEGHASRFYRDFRQHRKAGLH